jgi:hypothetical protein
MKRLFTFPTFNLELEQTSSGKILVHVRTHCLGGVPVLITGDLYQLDRLLSPQELDAVATCVFDESMIAEITSAVSVYNTKTIQEIEKYVRDTLGPDVRCVVR